MTETEYYKKSIDILDNLLEVSIETHFVENTLDWRKLNIYKQFKQAKHIIFCLLSNTEGSKYQNQTGLYVTELILVGSLGRIVTDNYVNIAYLTSKKFTIEEMQICWDYQIELKRSYLFEFINKSGFEDAFAKSEEKKIELRRKLDQLNFSTKGQVFQGNEGKLLSLKEIAEEKGFNKDKFEREFKFFSQFIHTTPFANNLITSNGVSLGFLAVVYDKIVPYYMGIVAETLELLAPNHIRLDEFRIHHTKFREGRWKI